LPNLKAAMSLQRIAVVAYDRISPFHLAVPGAVFGERHPDLPAIDFRVCTEIPGRLQTTAGFTIDVEQDLGFLRQAERPPQLLLDELNAAYQRGAQVVGLCLGAYILAYAGLLDGRKATTHWAYAQDFAARFPTINLDADVLYLEDEALITSAGTAAALDCCLYLLRKHAGPTVANSIARRLVISPHRQGGQAQFIEQPLPKTAQDNRIGELIGWVRQNLAHPHTLDSLAVRVLMSRRSFTRHFHQLTGMTVVQWLISERLALTQRLLESTSLSIEEIAEQVGFGSAVTLRQHFRKAYRISPQAWRNTFQ
jgi:transcriptional regulator GlxA family with amidase domain